MADRTVILITHQPPSRADRAARILALDGGRLSDPAGLVVVP
jgi:ABC-type multidrug transport system fused ATPase/permease subunit